MLARMSSFDLESRHENGEVRLALGGELDLTNARDLELRLDEAAPADTPLVVDLNAVSFIDSAALHVLFKLVRRRGESGLAFLVDPESSIAGTLRIVGLPGVATVRSSVAAGQTPGA